MAVAMPCEGGCVGALRAAEGIVGHHGGDVHAAGGEPCDRMIKEDDDARGGFIRQELRIRHARRIIDGDVQTFAARRLAWAPLRAIADDAMADHTHRDLSELLRVNVKQFASLRALMANDRGPGDQRRESAPSETPQHIAHRRRWQLPRIRDLWSAASLVA